MKKSKFFILTMCVMVAMFSINVFAGATSKVIGSVAEDRATLSLYAYTRSARAMTIPDHTMDCSTMVSLARIVYDSEGNPESEADAGWGATVAETTRSGIGNATYAYSTHQAGTLYSTLQVDV